MIVRCIRLLLGVDLFIALLFMNKYNMRCNRHFYIQCFYTLVICDIQR